MTTLSKPHQLELLALMILNQNPKEGAAFFEKCPFTTQVALIELLLERLDTLSDEQSLIHVLSEATPVDFTSLCLTRFTRDQFLNLLQQLDMDHLDRLSMQLTNPLSVKTIRQYIFKMEYVPYLADSTVEMILRELMPTHFSPSHLHWLIHGCHSDVIEKILSNVSKSNAKYTREDLELTKYPREKYTAQLQNKFIETAIKLEQYGCISLWHGPADPVYRPLTVHDFDNPNEALQSVRDVLEVYTHYSEQTIQRILRELDNRALLPILAAGSDLFWDTIMNNCSTRLSEMLSEDTKTAVLLNQISLNDVHDSIEGLKQVSERLMKAGEIECRPTPIQPRRP